MKQALVLSVVLLSALPAVAQDCPELLGRWPYGPATTVAVSGSTAYVGSGAALLVIDVSNPGKPQLLGDVALPEVVYGVDVAGDFAYVADGYSGLRVVDVGVPSAPVEVGFVDTPDFAKGVAVAGGHAYVADGSSGLLVISIANPSAPTEIGVVDTPSTAQKVAVIGDRAYVADRREGLRVISIANPSAPVEVGFLDTPGDALGVAVSGSLAYVADSASGLRIISVADPSLPVEVGFFETGCRAEDVAIDGEIALVAEGWCDLHLIDVGDPSTPIEVGIMGALGQTLSVVAAGGQAYVADSSGGLVIADISTPSDPTEVGSYQKASFSGDVVSTGGIAYVGTSDSTLRVFDVSAPSAPFEVGTVATRGTPTDLVLTGSYAFAAEVSEGLEVFDLEIPTAPVLIGWFDTPGEVRGVAIAGSHAYLADGTFGLRVIDVSVASAPVEVGLVDTPGTAYGVAVDGGYAYVADFEAGLRIIDVGDPTSPHEVGFVDTPGLAIGAALAGDYAVIADSQGGVRIVDVSSPTAPLEVGFFDGYYVRAVAVVGDRAYAACGGLLVLDISAPSAPVPIGFHETIGVANDLALDNGLVIVADYNAGIAVFGDCETTAFESIIPAAAVAAGAQSAFFQTDVEINNNGSADAQISFDWLPRGEDNSQPVTSDTFTLAAGESRRFENAVDELFGLGPDSFGAIRIVSSSRRVIGMSRTYNSPDPHSAATYGQGLPAVGANQLMTGTDPRHIVFLSEDTDSRANVGCVNAMDQALQVEIDVFDDHGALLDTQTMDLGPYGNDQINRILRHWQPVNGSVAVRGDGADARFYCYGSMLDNVTSDATTILPQVASSESIYIAAAALSSGLEGAFFQTDLDLKNVASTSRSYSLQWLPRGDDNSAPVQSESFSLSAGAGVRYGNVLREIFGLEPDRVGGLAVQSRSAGLIAMSRTYNLPAGGTAGTFGQAMPGIPDDEMFASGHKARIVFMNQNADLRANVGCQNGSMIPARVFVELFDGDGESLEVKTMDLPPQSNSQLTRVFRDYAPVSAGSVDVWTATAGASIYCYGSVLDNETSDPTTVLPQ